MDSSGDLYDNQRTNADINLQGTALMLAGVSSTNPSMQGHISGESRPCMGLAHGLIISSFTQRDACKSREVVENVMELCIFKAIHLAVVSSVIRRLAVASGNCHP